MPVWDDILTDVEREVIKGYGQISTVGDRPALLVIDMQNEFVGENAPILESIKNHPSSIGHTAWEMIPRQVEILSLVRQTRIPLIFTRVLRTARSLPEGELDFGIAGKRIDRRSSTYDHGDWAMKIVEDLAPNLGEGEILLDKNYASCFYATPLLSYLIKFNIDTLFVMGLSTSGCVRATAVDASSMNFDVVVVEDCVTDRIQASHKASLLDIWMKYGEVWPAAKVVDHFDKLSVGEKPGGS